MSFGKCRPAAAPLRMLACSHSRDTGLMRERLVLTGRHASRYGLDKLVAEVQAGVGSEWLSSNCIQEGYALPKTHVTFTAVT